MTTVAQIASGAFDAVSAAITDAIHDAVLEYETKGVYFPAAGDYALTTNTLTGGRLVVDTVRPAADIFPDYTIGPGDELLLLEGFTTIPKETWRVTANGITWELMRVQDIVAAGSLFYVMGRRK